MISPPIGDPMQSFQNSLDKTRDRATACRNRWNHWTALRTVTIVLGFLTTLSATFLSAVPTDRLPTLPWWLHPLILGLVAAFTALITALTAYYDIAAKKLIEAETCLAKLDSLQDSLRDAALTPGDAVAALKGIRDSYPSVAEYQPLLARHS